MKRISRELARGAFVLALAALLAAARGHAAPAGAMTDAEKKEQYVQAVVRGAGYLPWQARGLSREELEFRRRMEERKTQLLAGRRPLKHPVMVDAQARRRALRNIEAAGWARQMADAARRRADYIVAQPDGYVEAMIGKQTPWYDYGMTCPNCVGRKSQEGTGHGLLKWDYKNPDTLTCTVCGAIYPSAKYPETQKLLCPRTGQSFSFFLNPKEQAHPDDRSGDLAYKWVGHPMHMSFSGTIGKSKIDFMIGSLDDLALTYFITQDPRYARRAQQIMTRLAVCYRGWLYHDYWNTVADADPLYAAWHDADMPLEWKRHLCTSAFKRDSLGKAAMLRDFWGGGRLHPSTDNISVLSSVAQAYDLVADATGADGKPLWRPADRARVERDLLLEWVFTAEPYVGGPDQAKLNNNKSPRVYLAFASAARALGLPRLADTALRGYEAVRDRSFNYDGFSVESPGYTQMYLSALLPIPECLNHFDWPDSFAARQAAGDLYASDPKLRLIYRAILDARQNTGYSLPIEDSTAGLGAGESVLMGVKHYPEYFAGKAGTLGGGRVGGSLYALFNLEDKDLAGAADLGLAEIYFPAWMHAILRNGAGRQSTTLVLSFAPAGSHRHADNLAIFYNDRGQTILGDHGYVGDSPVNNWIASTFSHNVVVVDDKNQIESNRGAARHPRLELMLTTPRASAAEASSNANPQCSTFRRLVVMLKGPAGATCAVDIFRVKGGAKHDFRLFSELAASDAEGGALRFEGVALPPEPPLPDFGASLDRERIFGLRDARENAHPPAAWQAVWSQADRSYRFWCLGPVGRVSQANGPGQEVHNKPGRRVRYLDLINEGPAVASTFVGLHEPSLEGGALPVKSARRLQVPAAAGPDAVAIEIRTAWGSYLVLNEFAGEAAVEGVRFQGKLGIFGKDAGGKDWYLASGATTLQKGGLGFSGRPAEWSGEASAKTADRLTVAGRPAGWLDPPAGCRAYVLLNDGQNETGLPVGATTADSIAVERFPIPESAKGAFSLPALRYE